MTDQLVVRSTTQRLVVDSASGAVTVLTGGPMGPTGPTGEGPPGPPGPPGASDESLVIVDGFDQAAVDAAIAEIDSTNGTKMIFPPGTYFADISLSGHTNLVIEGYGATIIGLTYTNKVILVNNCDKLRIEGLTIAQFVPSVRNSGGVGLDINSSDRVSISECHFQTTSSAGMIIRGCNHVTVTGCTVNATLADGIHITGGSKYVTVQGCHIEDSGDDGIACVSYLASPVCEGISIVGNTIKHNKGRGITVIGGERVRIVGNDIDETKWAGIMIAYDAFYSSHGVIDVVVDGNTITKANTYLAEAVKPGVEIISGSATYPVQGVVVSNNIIREPAGQGIITYTNCHDVQIANNLIHTAGTIGIQAHSTKNVSIVGNTIIDAWQQGIQISSAVTGGIMIANNTVEDANRGVVAGTDAFQLQAAGQMVIGNRVIDNTGNIERDFEFSGSGTDAFFIGNRTSSVSGESVISPTASRLSIPLAMTSMAAAPTTGTWKRGDIVWNNTPSAGGAVGWICVTAGTPGTWSILATSGGSSTVSVTDSAEIDFTLTGSDITASLRDGTIPQTRLDAAAQAKLNQAHAAVTVTDSAEVDFTLTGQDITAVLKASSVAGSKLTPEVQLALAAAHVPVTVTDSSEIDFTLGGVNGQELTAALKDGSIAMARLDAAVQSAISSGGLAVTDTAEIDLTLASGNLSAAIVAASIVKTKLAAAVQTSLDRADAAILRTELYPHWIPANELLLLGGTPTLGQSGATAADRVKYWLMDAASTETIGGSFKVPATGLATVNIKVWWSPTSLAGGNVVLKESHLSYGVGDVPHATSTSGGNVTTASPTGSLLTVETTLATGAAVTAGKTCRFAIERIGADGADTYAADIGIYGVMIERAS